MKIHKHLKTLLQKEPDYIKDGRLFKNIIIEDALKMNPKLLSILLKDRETKKLFFQEIEGMLVFDKVNFQHFISNKMFLPDSFTRFKNKIGLTENDEYIMKSEKVVLSFPYKDCVLEGGQTKEKQKRNEIFYNQTLAPDDIDRLLSPKVLCNFQRFNKQGEMPYNQLKKENKTIKENIILKGNNLIALHTLKKQYTNKIKLIYIDPPYNTGGDANIFSYNNKFNHSTWLVFIKNRLEIAKELLKDTGFIAIAIDHYELFYLGTLADEVFGRENFLGIITVVHKPDGRQFARFFGTSTEYMLIYAKNQKVARFNKTIIEDRYLKTFSYEDEKGKYKLENFIMLSNGEKNLRINKPKGWYPIYVSKDLKTISLNKKDDSFYEVFPKTDAGQERTWKTYKNTFQQRLENDCYIAKKNRNGNIEILEKYRIDKGQTYKTHWVEKKYNATTNGTRLLKELLEKNTFSYPKSLYTVLDTLKITTEKQDLILDFFAGSGTTAHAVLALNKEDGGNRKFILVEQLEQHIAVCKERIQKVLAKEPDIKDDFITFELAKWNEKAKEQILHCDNLKELKGAFKEIKEKYFLKYQLEIKKFEDEMKKTAFQKLSLKEQKEMFIATLDMNDAYISESEIQDSEYGIKEEDKKNTKDFYGGF